MKAAAGVAAAVAAGSIAVAGVERADRLPAAASGSGGGQTQPARRRRTGGAGVAAGVASFVVMPAGSEGAARERRRTNGTDLGRSEQRDRRVGTEARGEGQGGAGGRTVTGHRTATEEKAKREGRYRPAAAAGDGRL